MSGSRIEQAFGGQWSRQSKVSLSWGTASERPLEPEYAPGPPLSRGIIFVARTPQSCGAASFSHAVGPSTEINDPGDDASIASEVRPWLEQPGIAIVKQA